MIDNVYFKQAELLLRVLPLVDREVVFALKGGTAINFFVRDLPRVSVDIDLVYLPIGERDLSLREISDALVRISRNVESRIPGTKIFPKKVKGPIFGADVRFNERMRGSRSSRIWSCVARYFPRNVRPCLPRLGAYLNFPWSVEHFRKMSFTQGRSAPL